MEKFCENFIFLLEETFEAVQYDYLNTLLDFLFQWETKQNNSHMNLKIKCTIPLYFISLILHF